jgi:transcriptional regulator
MYAPPLHRNDDRRELLGFMRQYNFAGLVTLGPDGVPRATHLPVIVDEDGSELRLIAHQARANPQWQDFAGGRAALAIFQGPHAYVTPSLYLHHPSVPTWNYVAVHATGPVQLLESRAAKLSALLRLSALHDADFAARFETLPADYLELKLGGIVAFEMTVTTLEARYKLSQERNVGEQQAISASLAAGDDSAAQALARLMRERLS